MNEKDISEKTLESHNDVFADIVNALLFEGKLIITESSLHDAQPFSNYKVDGRTLHAQERDVAKYWQNDTIRLSCFGFENQTEPEADMPLRVIGYDGASYRSQLTDKKQTDRYPIITLVLYFGTKHKWKKHRSLKETLSYDERLSRFISDYKINVFELAWLTDEEINRFKGDFKIVLEYLRAKRTGKIENWDRQKLEHTHEILDLLRVISNDSIFLQMEDFIVQIQKEEGGVGMCDFVQKIKREGFNMTQQEVFADGENVATNKIMRLFANLIDAGKTEEMKKAASDREYLKKLMDEYQK
ncbi:MAG: Rpn family recombination-promoting nuclease/putative transposase [Treponema sp.]|nr:Rpn family recombination-promoting nuclease/putative transposase [Treponema sp.]